MISPEEVEQYVNEGKIPVCQICPNCGYEVTPDDKVIKIGYRLADSQYYFGSQSWYYYHYYCGLGNAAE